VRANPSVQRNSDKRCWVAVRFFPISRDGNIQIDEGHGEYHRQAVISDQALDYRHGAKSRQYEAASLRHQLTGGSQPGGASSGVRL